MSYSLFLYAVGHIEVTSVHPVLKACLVEQEFCNDSDTTVFSTGSRLMEYINFLGCSPTLSAGDFDASIRIHSFEERTGLGGNSIETLRYPGCKHTIKQVDKWLKTSSDNIHWICETCGLTGEIKDINWRKSAAFSNFFIEITNIFPKEAIPTDALLALLKQCSHSDWLWFYSLSSN